MTPSEFQNIKQIALKSRVIYISVVIVVLMIVLTVLFVFPPSVKINPTTLKAKEREVEALEKQTASYQSLISLQTRRIEELSKRDSTLIKNVITNGEAIKKIKANTNESIKRFDSYGSNDWAIYFSKLPEPK